MKPYGRWGVRAACMAVLVFGSSARARADETLAREAARDEPEPVYVVTADAVHVISEQDLPTLREHPCKPKGKLSFYRAPPGVLDHCHGRLFLNGKVTSMATGGAGTAWDRTTYAVTGGFSLWGYDPRFARTLFEIEYGGGSGADGGFAYEYLAGSALAVPGLAVRGGTSLVLRGAPDFWHSRWELPALDVGWALADRHVSGRRTSAGLLDGAFAAELGARAALVVVGRFNLHDSSERLGGTILFGPYAVLSHRGAYWRTMLDARLSRIERDPPFHELDARFCSGTGLFMFCTRAEQRWMATEQAWSDVARASQRATTFTLSAAVTGP